MTKNISLSLILLSIVLMAGSFFWKSIASSSLVWDATSAERYADASADLHQLPDMHQHDDQHLDDAASTQQQQIIEKFEAAQQELVAARRFRDRGGMVMRIIGVIVGVVGLLMFVAQRDAAPVTSQPRASRSRTVRR